MISEVRITNFSKSITEKVKKILRKSEPHFREIFFQIEALTRKIFSYIEKCMYYVSDNIRQ